MEMPITVIITLFVAVVVAGALIAFSQHIILKGKEDISQIGPDTDVEFEDRLIELGNVYAQDVYNLALQCAKDISTSPDEKLCYVIKSDSFDDLTPLDNEVITVGGRNLTLNIDVSGSFNAIFIKYNPLGSVDIKS